MFSFYNNGRIIMCCQAMKHARRVYVGGLPPMANEQVISYCKFWIT